MAALTWLAPPISANNTSEQLRAWLTSIRDSLESVGIIQTDDVGQVDLENVEMPASSGVIGKLVFRLSDSLQDSFPVFFSIEFFRQGAVSTGNRQNLGWRAEVGNSTDGSSNILNRFGPIFGPYGMTATNYSSISDGPTDIAVQSWACHTEGFAGFVISPRNWASTGSGDRYWAIAIFLARTTNGVGEPTSEGAFVAGMSVDGPTSNTTWTGSTPITFHSTVDNYTGSGLPLMSAPELTANGDFQLQRVFLPANGLKNVPQLVMAPLVVGNPGMEFEAITAGTNPHNFVVLPGTISGFMPGHWNSNNRWSLAMRFE